MRIMARPEPMRIFSPIFLELFLVFGSVLAFGVWELYSLRRDKRRDKAAADRQQAPD
jgi:hypothetical protein